MSLTNLALPATKLRQAVIRCLFSKLTPVITSSPGMGKSDIMRSIAKEYRLKLIDFRVPQADVTDFNGLPFRNEHGKAEFLPFDIFPLAGDPLPDHPDGGKYEGWLIFLDELLSAPKHLQSPAYKLILDRMVGTHDLHERVVMAAAGNKAGDKAIVHEMSTALKSRLIHFELKLDHKEWMDWAFSHGIDKRVIAFLSFKPELLHRFDPESNDDTFACPRTWEFVSRLVTNHPISMDDLPLLAGTVSPGPAQEFISFVQVFDELPKIEDIIADPENAKMPHEPSTKFALATVLADKLETKNAGALCKYITRLPVECRVLCMRMLRKRAPEMIRNADVQKVFTPLIARL